MSPEMALSKLKIRKRLTKSAITRLENDINRFDSSVEPISELQTKIERLDSAWLDFRSIIQEFASFEQFEENAVYDEIEQVETQYTKARATAQQIIREMRRQSGSINSRETEDDAQSGASDNSQVTEVSQGSSSIHGDRVKLPKIDIPKFYGNVLEWNSFYNIFVSLIDSNASLNDVQKFLYLKSVVKGEAATVIASLDISDEHYREALNRLQERYDDKRIVIQSHVQAILDLPTVKKESAESLRSLIDDLLQHVRALQALNRPTIHWDDVLIQIVQTKIDSSTVKDWEIRLKPSEMPTFKQFVEFLNNRCHVLEAVHKKIATSAVNQKVSNVKKTVSSNSTSVRPNCSFCNDTHPNYLCDKFKELSVTDRIKLTRSKGLCMNCLRHNHLVKDCKGSGCKVCNKKHNSLLHLESSSNSKRIEDKEVNHGQMSSDQCGSTGSTTFSLSCSNSVVDNCVFLSTAIVKIQNFRGDWILARALLDSGSQASFMSEGLAKKLGLPTTKSPVTIRGINETMAQSNKGIKISFRALYDDFESELSCIILPRITSQQPLIELNYSEFKIPSNIQLADPKFYGQSDIDLLVGADKFWDLICTRKIKIDKHHPLLIETRLGWIFSGNFESIARETKQIVCNFVEFERLNQSITKFWEMENINESNKRTEEEEFCERLFSETTRRNQDG